MAVTNRNRLLERYVEVVREDGLNTNKNVNIGIAGAGSSATLSVGTGGINSTGALTPTGGVASVTGMPTVFHSGGIGMLATTGLTQKQIVTTETYFCEVFIPANTVLTGISVLNGHTTSSSQNTYVGLANATGTIVASSNTTTAQGTADIYQQIPFTATYSAVGPAKYYICVQGNATTGYIATYGTLAQNFGANKKTSETYGTFVTTASYSTTTFTTGLGPVADTY